MKIILNFSNTGQILTGLSRYSLSLLKALNNLNPNLNITAFVNKLAINHLPNNLKNLNLLFTSKFISPDFNFKGHILRLFWTNYLNLKEKNAIIFNPSQLEGVLIKNKSNKIITVVHDLIPLIFKRGKQYYYFKYFFPKVIENSEKIIAVSNFTKYELINYYKISEDKIHVIYNGISEIFKNFNLPRQAFILYVGRFEKLKNIEALIKAFTIFIKKYKLNYFLVLIGNGHIDESLINKEIKNKIKILKNVSDKELVNFYNTASLFIFPSLYEGFGFPPLEAMACGCPVIVSNVASLPEVCGDAAYYVDPYDVESIADGMYKILTDKALRENLIKNGLERVKQFSWEKTAREILKIIESLL